MQPTSLRIAFSNPDFSNKGTASAPAMYLSTIVQ